MPLAAWRPEPALAAAGLLGRLRNRLSGRWPSPEQVRAVFPHLSLDEAARVAWSIGGLESRNRLLVALLRRAGIGPLRKVVRASPQAFAALRPPRILGMFHVGAIQALGVAFERLPGPVLALRRGLLYPPEPPVEIVTTEGDDQWRAAVFHRALAHLERGGFVALALDEVSGPALRASCLGRELALARGPLALARITGAPVSPMVARWRGGTVEVEIGEELAAPPASEEELATAAAGWLERYLMAASEEIGLGLLRNLLSPVSPPAAGR